MKGAGYGAPKSKALDTAHQNRARLLVEEASTKLCYGGRPNGACTQTFLYKVPQVYLTFNKALSLLFSQQGLSCARLYKQSHGSWLAMCAHHAEDGGSNFGIPLSGTLDRLVDQAGWLPR